MARTERMNASVRLAFCMLVLMGSLAFLVTVWAPYNRLGESKLELKEARQKLASVEKIKSEKKRELDLLRHNPEYQMHRARDYSNRSKPEEHIFRIQR